MLIRDTEQGLMRQLDQIDLEILQVLYQDARITNKKLASMVKLAPSSCLERVKRLHSEGVIKRFGINLDYKALGGNIEAMTAVRLNRHSTDIVRSFRDDLLACPEVISVFHMGGENDFLLHITVRDSEHLRDFVMQNITSRAEVVHLETALVFEHARSSTLPALRDE